MCPLVTRTINRRVNFINVTRPQNGYATQPTIPAKPFDINGAGEGNRRLRSGTVLDEFIGVSVAHAQASQNEEVSRLDATTV
jgi:hypothetical protein